MPIFSQLLWSGEKKYVNAKDAKSIPSPRKFKRAEGQGLLQEGTMHSVTPTMCLCCDSEQAQTHPALPDQCKRAGRSVQTGAKSSPHQISDSFSFHKTSWNPELHVKQKGKAILWFSNFRCACSFEHSCSLFSEIGAISDMKILL